MIKHKLQKNAAWIAEIFATNLRRLLGMSNYRKWTSVENLSPNWDSRTELIAALIPAGSSVIEFGAGRMVLKHSLRRGCSYTPSDLVDRGEGTLVCDLNAASLPHFPTHDIAVFSGVLEYVNDVPRLVSHLSKSVDIIIASYGSTDFVPKIPQRRFYGWVNDHSSNEFLSLFSEAGFHCEDVVTWREAQIVARFLKKK